MEKKSKDVNTKVLIAVQTQNPNELPTSKGANS